MKIFGIIFAVLVALVGLRLLFAGLKAFIMFFKVNAVPRRARQTMFRDIVLGILFLLLAAAILT
ncbi:MAG: hypothetical protein ACE5G8_08885 [Anaerolineae bacterium]